MQVVVITGSTRGIGYGLAKAFLPLDCAVVINGRHASSVSQAAARLREYYRADWILEQPADIRDPVQVRALWYAAVRHFGHVDIWINNAGISHRQAKMWELEAEAIQTVIETNLQGTLNGATMALEGMLEQGHGKLYNMEGLGSDGRVIEGLSIYGSTKRAIRYLTRALAQEASEMPVIVGSLSPGMVVTDLLTTNRDRDAAAWERAKRIYNILGDQVDTVAPWLARRALENERNGARIAWLTPLKAAARFALSPFRQRDLFADR